MLHVSGPVLFDVDGTLLVGSISHLAQLGRTLGRLLGVEVAVDIAGERPIVDGVDVSGWVDVQVVRAVIEARDGAVHETTVTAVMAEFERRYDPTIPGPDGPIRVIAGVSDALARLHDAGLRLGLVTGNASFVARAKLRMLGLDAYFRFDRDLGFGDWRTDRTAVAAAAVEGLAADAHDRAGISYVGDTPRDMQAAKAAGVRAIGVLSGVSDEARLVSAGADVVIASVADIYPE